MLSALHSPLSPSNAARWAGLAFVLCLALFSLSHLGVQTSDDAATFAAAAAWWERGSPAISHVRWLHERVGVGRNGRDGELYTKYGIGQIGLGAALYGLGRTVMPRGPTYDWAGFRLARSRAAADLAQHLNTLLGSLVVALVVYALARRAGLGAAALGALLLAAASPFWLAGRGFGSEVGTALGLLVAVLLADAALSGQRRGLLFLSALGVAFAALFRPAGLVFAAAYLAWLWGRPRRDWLAVGLGLGLGVAVLLGYNIYRFGSPWDAGYTGGFQLHWLGVAGLLVSPGRGLVFFAPWALAFVPAAWQAPGRRRDFWRGLTVGVAVFCLFHAMWLEWEGGWAYGPRLLIPILPILTVYTAPYLLHRPALAVVLWAPGLIAQVATLRLDPIVTYDRISREAGLTFEQTVWSWNDSILAHQVRAGLAGSHEARILGIAIVIAAACVLAWRMFVTRTMTRYSRATDRRLDGPGAFDN